VERSTGASGRRVTTGTYTLTPESRAAPTSSSSPPGSRLCGASSWPRHWSGR